VAESGPSHGRRSPYLMVPVKSEVDVRTGLHIDRSRHAVFDAESVPPGRQDYCKNRPSLSAATAASPQKTGSHERIVTIPGDVPGAMRRMLISGYML
jgi:hypothetical protein